MSRGTILKYIFSFFLLGVIGTDGFKTRRGLALRRVYRAKLLHRLNDETEQRISLGQPSGESMFPYMASLLFDGEHYCGGSVISKNVILTAAHCCFNLDTKEPIGHEHLSVSVGHLQWKQGRRYNVKKKLVHEQFVLGNLPHDIAMFIIEPHIIFTATVKPLHLNPARIPDDYESVLAVVSGWGYTVDGEKTIEQASDVLMYVNVSTIPREECVKKLELNVLKSQICVFTGTGAGTCGADSGAPLISYGQQVGILSFGVDCMNRKPEVYTRISDYYDWVMHHMKRLERAEHLTSKARRAFHRRLFYL